MQARRASVHDSHSLTGASGWRAVALGAHARLVYNPLRGSHINLRKDALMAACKGSSPRPTVAALCLLAVLTSVSQGADWREVLRPLQEDAELADVCFVDATHGWAVGDRGVIWHTDDGGRSWRLQTSGVNCRLASVCFLDAQTGWAAGGVSQPYTHTTVGVLLATRDGGRTWLQDKSLLLPAIHRIVFFNATHGWALGESSAMFPTGLFTTDNGGRSWTPLTGLGLQGWLAGDFTDGFTGAVAGRRGALAVVRRRGLEETRTPDLGLRGLRQLRLAGPTGGWLVGDGGLVLRTEDLGRTWQTPPGDVAAAVGNDFDFKALDVRGQHCWIAGAPGTRVLHSADSGRTWQAFATNYALPIHDLEFIDDQRGWAVGALGTILATHDGGRTWRRQRGTATRAALLGLFSEPQDVPLALFARLSGNDGYLGVCEIVNRRDVESPQVAEQTLADRAHMALVGAGAGGAETAWSFPLRQSGLSLAAQQITAGWDGANDGRGVEKLEAMLVRKIRCWRPDVVVTHAASPRGEDPLGHMLNQIVLRAAEQAADPTRFPEQTAQMGLEPWQVKKVFGSLPAGQLGSVNLTTTQIAPRLACAVNDAADAARGQIADRYAPTPATLGFQLFVDNVPQGAGERDFFSGIVLHPGSDARRMMGEPIDQGADLMRRVAQRHRQLQAILSRPDKSGLDTARHLAQIGDLTGGLDADAAGDVLFQLADQYARSGRWELASETLHILVDRYPEHPLVQPALVWLVQCWSSGEVAWQMRRVGGGSAQQMATAHPAPQGMTLGQVLPPAAQVGAGEHGPNAGAKTGQVPLSERAAGVARRIEQRYPGLFVEPRVQFPLSVANRDQGLARPGDRFFAGFLRTRPHDAWWACAAGEQWLVDPGKAPPPKDAWQVAACTSKPRLDGELTDDIWKQARPVELHSALGDDQDWPAVALAAYDQEFLYLAVNCRRPPGRQTAVVPNQPRARDLNLQPYDRVEVYLDLDRDYATWYRLTVDERGWVADECWGDTTWNPQWFVAARQDEQGWTVEAAVPLAEFAHEKPQARGVWAAGVQRTVPGVGFQSWTTPAATTVTPEGFGFLVFE